MKDLDFTMARALHHIAGVDGLSPPEEALLKSFYPGDLGDDDWKDEELDIFEGEDKVVFFQTCMYMVFADGKITDPEREILKSWAGKLSVPEDQLQSIFSEVREAYLGQLRSLPQPPANMDELEAGFTL